MLGCEATTPSANLTCPRFGAMAMCRIRRHLDHPAFCDAAVRAGGQRPNGEEIRKRW